MTEISEKKKLPKNQFIEMIKPGTTVHSSFLVRSKETFVAKNGKPYLVLLLGDKTGSIDSRVWESVEKISQEIAEGDLVAVLGKPHLFQGRLQLVIEHLTRIPSEDVDMAQYLLATAENLDEAFNKLVQAFEGLKNPWIRDLGLQLLQDPEIGPRYKLCPAAKTIHHAFLGGLLLHSLQLIRVIDAIFPLYENLDRDLLVFGAAFHDFGKIFELSYSGSFGYTDEGRLVGHLAIGTMLIDRKIQAMPDFPKDLEWQLKHLILSHHGKLEYGSPKRPATLEAQIVHSLDDLDSKINSIQTLMKTEKNGQRWTSYHKGYDQYYYKSDCYVDKSEEKDSGGKLG